MDLCPNCGHVLKTPLIDGIAACHHCSHVFDSSNYNRLLSAAWVARKKHYDEVVSFVRDGFSENEAELVLKYVVEEGYNHQEWLNTLNRLGVNKLYESH